MGKSIGLWKDDYYVPLPIKCLFGKRPFEIEEEVGEYVFAVYELPLKRRNNSEQLGRAFIPKRMLKILEVKKEAS